MAGLAASSVTELGASLASFTSSPSFELAATTQGFTRRALGRLPNKADEITVY